MGKEYKIDISPEILELLGPSLYTNIYYVLAELIANAYDADAQNVYIINEGDSIIVEDDGSGMDYASGVKRYLSVAKPTRVDTSDDVTPVYKRKRMGRKGVGKLAALSVSSRVHVMTRTASDQSGFVLSRAVADDGLLEPIEEDEIVFREVNGTGTSVVMTNPEYPLHKTLSAWKRNLLRMFPIVAENFRIHLISGREHIVLDEFDKEVVPQLSTLITIGEEFAYLGGYFTTNYDDIRNKVCVHYDSGQLTKSIHLKSRAGDDVDCDVAIKGWIGTYKTTAGRKKDVNDFPDNYLSIFAHGKLGEYNIIPILGQNRLNESYIVGQLHIDCFEDTSLPDMAMSNRQGYKTSDPRYQAALEMIRPELFTKIINLRDVYTDRKKLDKKRRQRQEREESERELKKKADEFAATVSDRIAEESQQLDEEGLAKAAAAAVNDNLPLLGLKHKVDANKKKILISHAREDKELATFIYDLLVYNNVNPSDILYTSSENEESRIPEGDAVFDYLRTFFVESASTQMINVIFVTSESSAKKWAPVCEVGAAWITKASHKIFNVSGHHPQKPLDDETEWHTSTICDDGIHMSKRDVDVLRVKIKCICESIGVEPQDDSSILAFIESHVEIDGQ